MSRVFFIGDLHFGHKGIQRFRGMSEEENRQLIIDNWNKIVTKRDKVWVMGDSVFYKPYLQYIDQLEGRKFLIRGNHDMLSTEEYMSVFEEVHGIFKYKNFWLSHAPIHPNELRGKRNIHGHVHFSTVLDSYLDYDFNYFNTSCEMLNYTPISYEEIMSIDYDKYQEMAIACDAKRIALGGSLEHCA